MDVGFDFSLSEWLPADLALRVIRALALIVIGVVVVRLLRRGLHRLVGGEIGPHRELLLRRGLTYLIFALFATGALHQLGFDLTVLLGAAGVLGVAIGFASQTSAANLVSGLFLIAEHPFGVGDTIRVGGTTGEVISLDLLSAKLRTFDNLLVRIPNEMLIKSEITNLTRFAIRRLDIQLGVAYKENVERVRAVLFEVADRNPLSLEEPTPLFIFTGYGDSALQIQFSVWAARANFLELRNSIHHEIKEAFDNEGIEIPFPHRSLYSGSETTAFPVRIVEGAGAETPATDSDAGASRRSGA
ncbi:MAG: mechanosensitive ion channel family protein [Myxococcales bacterium]|nr:mechanosensitive ion channel family protein [Myxococcales bacterium]